MEYIFTALEIDNFLTHPYQEMNFNDVDTGKIYFYFTETIANSNFDSIYLTNSTHKIFLYNRNTDLCTFTSKLVRCIVPHKFLHTDENNQNHKFYYMLKYKEDTEEEFSGMVTVAVSSGYYFKAFALFVLVLLF
jgi:hypothetical protein